VARLTKVQRRITQEIDEITEELGLNHRALIKEFVGTEYLTPLLKIAREELIAAAIVHEYTYIDELFGSIIAKYFFGAAGGRQVWRTKRFQRFNYFILERLYVQQKLALVKDIHSVPREAVAYVEKVNDLRNAVAHAFFPENLRGKRTTYKRIDVFSIEGFRALREDRAAALDPLFRRAYGITP
jgi:hypothetical protein